MPYEIDIYARAKNDRRWGYFSSTFWSGETYHSLHLWAWTIEWFTWPRKPKMGGRWKNKCEPLQPVAN